MQRRFSSQPSALERAQKQLQGTRLSLPSDPSARRSGTKDRSRDDGDLDAYLSKLNRKVSLASGKKTNGALSDHLSDLSISSDDADGGHAWPTNLSASRFVKKSHSQTLEDSGSLRRKNEALAGGATLKKSATMPSSLNKSAPVYASAALQKAAQLGAKFAKQKQSADNLVDSESDFDVSLSDDGGKNHPTLRSKTKGSLASGSNEKLPSSGAKKTSLFSYLQSSDDDEPKKDGSKFLKKSAKPSFYVGESDNEDDNDIDNDIGRDGNKFLKKSTSSKQPAITPSKTDTEEGSASRFLKKSTKKAPFVDAKPSEAKMKSNDDKSPPKRFTETGSFLTSTPTKESDGKAGTSNLLRTAPSGAMFGLDSDEEDLQDFIMNLSPTSSPEIPPIRDHKPTGQTKKDEGSEQTKAKATPGRRPATPAAKKTLPLRDVDSPSVGSAVADDTAPSIVESIDDGDDDKDFFSGLHTNIMQLEDLEPVGINVSTTGGSSQKPKASSPVEKYEDVTPDEISEHNSVKEDVFAGLQTVDDLLVREKHRKHSARKDSYKSNFESADEIGTEIEHSISEVLSEGTLRRSGSKTPGEVYADDTFVSQTDSPSEARTSTRTVPDSHSEVTSEEDTRRRVSRRSLRSGSKSHPSRTKTVHSYSDDFHSKGTDTDVEDFSTEDDSRLQTESVTHSRSFTSYTESKTVTRSERTPRKGHRKERKKERRRKDAAVQADGATSATHRWLRDLDLSALGTVTGIDPSPVAMHIINPQALEALTSYSPSILAMNETLISQLRHTRESIQASLRLHESLVENIETDYRYTTLEDTKEYIRRHRRPKLTLEQAFEEVRRDMEDGYR